MMRSAGSVVFSLMELVPPANFPVMTALFVCKQQEKKKKKKRYFQCLTSFLFLVLSTWEMRTFFSYGMCV